MGISQGQGNLHIGVDVMFSSPDSWFFEGILNAEIEVLMVIQQLVAISPHKQTIKEVKRCCPA